MSIPRWVVQSPSTYKRSIVAVERSWVQTVPQSPFANLLCPKLFTVANFIVMIYARRDPATGRKTFLHKRAIQSTDQGRNCQPSKAMVENSDSPLDLVISRNRGRFDSMISLLESLLIRTEETREVLEVPKEEEKGTDSQKRRRKRIESYVGGSTQTRRHLIAKSRQSRASQSAGRNDSEKDSDGWSIISDGGMETWEWLSQPCTPCQETKG